MRVLLVCVRYTQADTGLVTYGDSVESLPRAKRHALKGSFTEEGSPGATYSVAFAELIKALALPAGASDALSKAEADIQAMFASGNYHLLPSFFQLILHLEKEQRTFSIVFRTFGSGTCWLANRACTRARHVPSFHPSRRRCVCARTRAANFYALSRSLAPYPPYEAFRELAVCGFLEPIMYMHLLAVFVCFFQIEFREGSV